MLYLIYGLISAMVWLISAGTPELSPDDARLSASNESTKAIAAEQSASKSASAVDARRFFELLVERYRGLTSYSDMSRIVQVIQHAGEAEPRRVETEMSSEVADGALRTETAWTQIRRTFGLNMPLPSSEPMDRTELRYQLWMLPHLTLKFSEEPLREFRDGILEGFTATELASVTVDDRSLVHLELRSGDGQADDAAARFDIFVDPESMLIERISGKQRLPDGGNYETTVEITPREHQSTSETDRPAYTGWPLRARDADADGELDEKPDVNDITVREPEDQSGGSEPSPYPPPRPCETEPECTDKPERDDSPTPPKPGPNPTPAPGPSPPAEPPVAPQPDRDAPPKSGSSSGQSRSDPDVPSRKGMGAEQRE